MLKADDQAEYASLLESFTKLHHHREQSVFGVNYVVEQGDAFSFPRVYTEVAHSLDDNFATPGEVVNALYCDQFQLFGSLRVHPSSHDIQLNPGLVHRANGGVLILSAAMLLSQFDLWLRLKHILQTQTFDWYSAHPFKHLPCDVPSYKLNLKVIVLGSRTELATLGELEESLYSFADYAEIESYISVAEVESQKMWAGYVKKIAQTLNVEMKFFCTQ